MRSDVQRAARVNDFFAAHQAALERQGSVVTSWREDRRAGPYFRLETRLPDGTRRAIYLGPEGPLVASTRSHLAKLQSPLRERRQLAKVQSYLRHGLRAARENVAQELCKIGLRLKGSEIRGTGRGKPAQVLATHLMAMGAPQTPGLEI